MSWSKVPLPEKKKMLALYRAGNLDLDYEANRLSIKPESLRRKLNELAYYQQLLLDESALSAEIEEFHQATSYDLDLPSLRKQKDIIGRSIDKFEKIQNSLQSRNQPVRLVFASDIHIPYQDEYAIEMTAKIVADFKPHYMTALNDVFDFSEYSTRWNDKRSQAAKLWSSDLENAFIAHDKLMDIWISASPETTFLGLMANHDKRLMDYLRDSNNSSSEVMVYEFMKRLEGKGVLQFTNGRENIIKLSPGLKLVHGVSASKNPATVAKSTLEALSGKQYEEDSNIWYNVIYGHDHRSIIFDYQGVTAYGSGCLCGTNPHYLKYPPNWHQGIVLGYYYPNSRVVEMTRVNYNRMYGKITAFFGDKEYVV
ncbi:MAG: hypothetical protein CUN55_00610 [Phototrophicales bacterium]|nr:MAG: hypothetical protein CUN55_00610 [Phototrophicales bacterium]